MKKIKVGEGKKKVLLIHGWMSSSRIYKKFVEDLGGAFEVNLIDLPGFGEGKFSKELFKEKNFLEFYKLQILKILKKEKFDIIVGHSLGCNIILRAIDEINFTGKVILFNPCYKGIDYLKFIASSTKVNMFLFKLQKSLPRWIAKPLIKLISLLSVNKLSLINNFIIDDVREADPYIAAKVMKELVFDNWEFKNKNNIRNITIVRSEKDRLIKEKKINSLIKDIGCGTLITLKNIGHTPMLEDYNNFIKIFREEAEKIN